MLNKQCSGNSNISPSLFSFLEDDPFKELVSEESKRTKFKTEYAKRDRQESEDSCQEASQLAGDAQAYIDSILPNSIKFNKPTHSVSALCDNECSGFLSTKRGGSE